MQREQNILSQKSCIDGVPALAKDLISWMISANYRPTSKEVLKHAFFWDESKKLEFICDISDRVEKDSGSIGLIRWLLSKCT